MSNPVTRSAIGVSSEPEGQPRISVSQVSTLAASFADDVRTYAAAGLDGIGVWELKLGDGPDDEAVAIVKESGLGSASAVPAVPSINPLPLLPGPDNPRERTDAILASLNRLAAFEPAAVVAITGPFKAGTAYTAITPCNANAAPAVCPASSAPQYGPNSLGTINLVTGALSKVTFSGALTPKGMVFVG